MVHPTEDLVYWIRHGMQGMAMPGFDAVLSDQDTRGVLSYSAAQQTVQRWSNPHSLMTQTICATLATSSARPNEPCIRNGNVSSRVMKTHTFVPIT
jgi:hypothetical protein